MRFDAAAARLPFPTTTRCTPIATRCPIKIARASPNLVRLAQEDMSMYPPAEVVATWGGLEDALCGARDSVLNVAPSPSAPPTSKPFGAVTSTSAAGAVSATSPKITTFFSPDLYVCMFVCFSVCNGEESQRLGALLRWRVFYSVYVARRAFGTHKRLETDVGDSGVTLSWFRSYLPGRSQSVSCADCTSPCHAATCGVPQGSVLGPLLFCIYTRPVELTLQKHDISYYFYADKTQLHLPFDSS